MHSDALSKLIPALQKAHVWLSELEANPQATITSIAEREHKTERHIRMILSLAFVAPDIVEAAIARTLPRGLSMSRLTDLPMLWNDQRRTLGLSVR